MHDHPIEYDGPWKEALDAYFPDFMRLCFPRAHAEIDWTRGYESLDAELQQITGDAALGRRVADKLLKVWRIAGDEAWVLVHIEVQTTEEVAFAERMYVYNYRLFDRYHRRVASLAVLGDEQPGWRPMQFGYELWGCTVGITFPVVKLLDYRGRWAELAASDNPFAVVVMAHLKAQETRGAADARKDWKFALVRQLYERGYRREEVLKLFRCIDWLMRLPEGLDRAFWRDVQTYEEAQEMDYITSVERIGRQEGLQQGLQQGLRRGVLQGQLNTMRDNILNVLNLRFAYAPEDIREIIARIEDVEVLQLLFQQAILAESPQEFSAALPGIARND